MPTDSVVPTVDPPEQVLSELCEDRSFASNSSAAELTDLAHRHRYNLSVKQMAEMSGVSRHTLYTRLAQGGLPSRLVASDPTLGPGREPLRTPRCRR